MDCRDKKCIICLLFPLPFYGVSVSLSEFTTLFNLVPDPGIQVVERHFCKDFSNDQLLFTSMRMFQPYLLFEISK